MHLCRRHAHGKKRCAGLHSHTRARGCAQGHKEGRSPVVQPGAAAWLRAKRWHCPCRGVPRGAAAAVGWRRGQREAEPKGTEPGLHMGRGAGATAQPRAGCPLICPH